MAYKGRTEKCNPCPVEKTFLSGESHYSEEIWNRDGREQHIVVRTSPLRKQLTGEIVAVIEMCTNITELRMMKNRLALLGETIAGTSHAMNILSGLEGGAYISRLGAEIWE